MKREPEPLEQIDLSGIYRSHGSPQQNMNLRVDGGGIAIAISILALGGVLVGAVVLSILLPKLNEVQIRAEVAEATKPIAVQAASAQDRAWLAKQESTINAEQLKEFRVAMADAGFKPRLDGH